MAMAWLYVGLMAILSGDVVPCSRAQDLAPAPGPSGYGNVIDQGIACVLMLVALVLTYLTHPSSSYSFF